MYQSIQSLADGTYVLLGKGDADLVEVIRLDIDYGYWVAARSLMHVRLIPNMVIGIWTAKDGTKYVDESIWLPEEAVALQVAKACGQISIWDCHAGEAIYL